MDLSLVITCYNEEPHLKASFDVLKGVLNQTKWTYEFIFVDDRSADRTRGIIEEIISENKNIKIKTIFHEKNLGRGQSVSDGIRAASGEVVGFLDIDLEIPAYYVVPAALLVKDRLADFVMAKRIYKFSLGGLLRYFMSRGYNFLVRRLLGLPFLDTEAGFKFFNRSKIFPILGAVEDQRWFWDTEVVARAFAGKLKILLLPTVFIRNPEKKTTVKIFKDSWDYFVSLLRFRSKFLK